MPEEMTARTELDCRAKRRAAARSSECAPDEARPLGSGCRCAFVREQPLFSGEAARIPRQTSIFADDAMGGVGVWAGGARPTRSWHVGCGEYFWEAW